MIMNKQLQIGLVVLLIFVVSIGWAIYQTTQTIEYKNKLESERETLEAVIAITESRLDSTKLALETKIVKQDSIITRYETRSDSLSEIVNYLWWERTRNDERVDQLTTSDIIAELDSIFSTHSVRD